MISLEVVHQQCFAFIEDYPSNVGAYLYPIENVHVVTKNSSFHVLVSFDNSDEAIRKYQGFANISLKVQLVYFGESREISYHDVALSYKSKNARMNTECHVEASISALSSENGKKLFALRFIPVFTNSGLEVVDIQPVVSSPILVISKKKVLDSKTYSDCAISYNETASNSQSKRRRLSTEKATGSPLSETVLPESTTFAFTQPSYVDQMVFSLQNLSNTFIQASEKVDANELLSNTISSLSPDQIEALSSIFTSLSSSTHTPPPPCELKTESLPIPIHTDIIQENEVPSENDMLSSLAPSSLLPFQPLSPLSCSFNSLLKESWGSTGMLES